MNTPEMMRVFERLDRALDRFDALCVALTLRSASSVRPTTQAIIELVAERHGLTFSALLTRRDKIATNARSIAMYVARQHTFDSYPDIARAFRRHHVSIISVVRKVGEQVSHDASLRAEIHSIERMLPIPAGGIGGLRP